MRIKAKKTVYLLILCFLFQLTVVGVPVIATNDIWDVNLLKNADFEETVDGVPTHWNASSGWNNEEVFCITENPQSGSNCVVIKTQKTTNPWTAQVVNVVEDTLYEASVWVKTKGEVDGRGVAIKIEYFKEPEVSAENFLTGMESEFVKEATDGWQYLRFRLKAPIGTKAACIYLRLYGKGEIYFDNASFKAIEVKPVAQVTTDQIFYYAGQQEGTVKAELYPSDENYDDKLVDIRISNADSGDIIVDTTNAPAQEHVQVTFDPRDMMLLQPYKVQLTLKANDQTVLEYKETTIYSCERPATLSENGTVLVNGKPFFPVIGYNVYPDEYSRVELTGVNTVIGISTYDVNALKTSLDMAHLCGLKVIVPLDQKLAVNIESIRKIVNELRDHPAVLAWKVMENPTANKIALENLINAYLEIRTLDTIHPVFLSESSEDQFEKWAKVTDILCTSVYPLPNLPVTEIGNVVRSAQLAVKSIKPVWTNLQTYHLPFSPDQNYLPDIEEVRHMAYQAMFAGSQGIGYYSFHDEGYWLEASELWSGLTEFRNELGLIIDLMDSAQLVERYENQVRWALWNKNESETYVIALNEAAEERQIDIPVSFERFNSEQIYGRKTFPQENRSGQMQITLEPLQAAVYKVTPTSSPVIPPAQDPGPGLGSGTGDETDAEHVKSIVYGEGNAKATLSADWMKNAVDKALEEAKKTGGSAKIAVEIEVEETDDVNSVEISIPKEAIDILAEGKVRIVEVSNPIATIVLDEEAISTICSQSTGDVEINSVKVEPSTLSDDIKARVGDRPVYDFSVKSGNRTISEFGGNVAVTVPYTLKAGEDPNALVIYFINDRGELEMVRNCVYNPSTGTISFRTTHFSMYAVGYNKVTFKDVTPNSWYYDAVTFIAARKITEGTGNGNYGPADLLTRGQFIVMVMKAYGLEPDAEPKDNFADAGNTYYTGYLASAKRLGISAGIGNNLFGPELKITRQEMFALLYNILKLIDELPHGTSGKTVYEFSDASSLASWGKDAMTLFVETGVIKGDGNKLNPEDNANRAEMAQILYTLLAR